ncbi:unnamed protein product [Hermetia illucens]|uniref:Follicle cell protein 3C-1 n=1 Tax=Hermetia illucens TaxID=343691 RepID=A0A7R8V5Z0_HERIL|nr:follicle cell protein 3C-1 [Hermetia illucens]CAD7092722.1 unnamed protein product [Hermetia illucens]
MGILRQAVLIGTIVLIGSRSLVYGAQQTQPPVSNALVPPVLYLTETTPSTPTVTPRPGRHHVLTPRPKNNTIYPCTCGVFLSSQFKKGSTEPPKGAPVVRHEQDKVFPCTPLGIRQCQNKCLEAFVKHLPNAGPILCSTMERDCHKEKAYLFVQNCKPNWVNSNLSNGKEYCCKDGVQYPCPLI